MTRLEDLQPNAAARGILPDCLVTVVSVQWFGSEALELTYKDPDGRVANRLIYRHDEPGLELLQRGAAVAAIAASMPALDAEDFEDLEDAPEDEAEAAEEEILDQATAARTIDELKAEIATLRRLEGLALVVRRSGEDRKWSELADLLSEIFTPTALADALGEPATPYGGGEIPPPVPSYNGLVQSWPEITRLARERAQPAGPSQMSLPEE